MCALLSVGVVVSQSQRLSKRSGSLSALRHRHADEPHPLGLLRLRGTTREFPKGDADLTVGVVP
jgi:hypothetical protein